MKPTMTRAEWYAAHRYCRMITKMMKPYEQAMDEIATQQFTDLMIYGYCTPATQAKMESLRTRIIAG